MKIWGLGKSDPSLARIRVFVGITTIIFMIAAACQDGSESIASPDKGTDVLKLCPESPNCVSTQAEPDDTEHFMAPIAYTGPVDTAKARLLQIVTGMPRTTIIEDRSDYLHIEFRSLIFRFVDDVEFLFDEQAHLIHFRSASRIGYSDLGVNRKRMQSIVDKFRS